MKAAPRQLSFIVAAVLAPALLLLAAGCDDDPPSAPETGEPDPYVAATPESLLTVVFENAYNTEDSVHYEAMLDTLYEFENLPNNPDDPLDVVVWGHNEEMTIAGRMFSGWENGNGVKVLNIDLDITLLSQTESSDSFADQPEGETWWKCATEVDLTVVTADPSSNDGSGIVNRVVFSNQDFTVKPDPDDADRWVIRRQVDRPPITKEGTEDGNWGEIKSLFRVEEAEPENSTPTRLFFVAMQNAYNARDSVAYEALLDDRYEFENLPENPDDPLDVVVWGHGEEMTIAGRMFSGWTNGAGIRVLDIDLLFRRLSKTVTTDSYEDRPEGEVWYDVDTDIDLTVVTQDPSANDGSGIVNRVVYSGQDFVARPDPDDPEVWVIRRQIDRPPIHKAGTEQTSWSGIKGLFQ